MRGFISVILLTIFFVYSSNAQVGCLTDTGNLYTSDSGVSYNGFPAYNWNGNVNDPNRISGASGSKCLRSYSPKKQCYIRYSCNSSGNNCSYYSSELVNYGPLPCPIDDYIPYTLLGVGGLGFIFIRRRNFAV